MSEIPPRHQCHLGIGEAKAQSKVLAFLDSLSEPWICSITLHERVFGAEHSPDPGRRAKLLAWIERIATEFSNVRSLLIGWWPKVPGDCALAASKGCPASLADALIAASAEMRPDNRDPEHPSLRGIRCADAQPGG